MICTSPSLSYSLTGALLRSRCLPCLTEVVEDNPHLRYLSIPHRLISQLAKIRDSMTKLQSSSTFGSLSTEIPCWGTGAFAKMIPQPELLILILVTAHDNIFAKVAIPCRSLCLEVEEAERGKCIGLATPLWRHQKTRAGQSGGLSQIAVAILEPLPLMPLPLSHEFFSTAVQTTVKSYKANPVCHCTRDF